MKVNSRLTAMAAVLLLAGAFFAGCVTNGIDASQFNGTSRVRRITLPGGVQLCYPEGLRLYQIRPGYWLIGLADRPTSPQLEVLIERISRNADTVEKSFIKRLDWMRSLGRVEKAWEINGRRWAMYSIMSNRRKKSGRITGSMHGYELFHEDMWVSVSIFKKHAPVSSSEWSPDSIFTASERNLVSIIADTVKILPENMTLVGTQSSERH